MIERPEEPRENIEERLEPNPSAPGGEQETAPAGRDAGPRNVPISDGDAPEAPEAEAEAGPEPAAEEAPAQAPSESEVVEALRAERDHLKDQLLRARAEFDNFRKRKVRETEQIRRTAAEDLMRDLLPVVDNLERSLAHAEDPDRGFAQGIEMVLKQLCDVLQRKGLEPIPAVGEPFDPNVHEALAHQPSEEYPADRITEEYQRGYRLGEYVLRPSKVVVSSGPPAEQGGSDNNA